MILRKLSTCVLLAMTCLSPALAQEEVFIPQLHDVSGVASDDTLNIRAEPTSSAAIIGELPPGATGIEVTALTPDGTWGRIGAGEVDGWISLSFTDPRPFPTGDVPDGMHCSGTEPFWSLRFGAGSMGYSTPQADWPDVPVLATSTRIPPGNQIFGFDAAVPGGSLSGVIEAGWCSDGMSDRTFGWQIVLLRQEAGAMFLETGCCTLDQR